MKNPGGNKQKKKKKFPYYQHFDIYHFTSGVNKFF